MKVTCVPGLTSRFFGLTPLDVIVIVEPAAGGDGDIPLLSLPHAVAKSAIAVVTTSRRTMRSS